MQTYVQWGRSDSCSNGHATLYTGTMMGEHYSHYRSDTLCIDNLHESRANDDGANENGRLFYYASMTSVSANNGLYPEGSAVGCSVCGVPPS